MDSLSEISKQTENNIQVGVFSQYRDKAEIGELILKDMLSKKYSFSQKGKKGFFMAENERGKIGLLSQCLGLETIAVLRSLNIDFFKESEELDKKTGIIKDTLLNIFSMLELTQEKVEAVLNGEGEKVTLKYDCTPFFDNDDVDDDYLKITDYVDSMAKVLETFCEFRGFYNQSKKSGIKIEIDGFKDLSQTIDAVIIKSILDINVSALKQKEPVPYYIGGKVVKDAYGQDMLYKGWNYCDMLGEKAEPSLYYTYAVCSSYMAFWSEFKAIISNIRNIQNNGYRDKNNCPNVDCGNDKDLERDYEFFKKAYKTYITFNKACVDAGHYVDKQICDNKLDISKDFIGFGFSKITFEEIANSTTNDAMINNLFAVLIYLYSGTDFDYDKQGKLEELNNMLLYATQNVLRSYKLLEKSNKAFIVDQYVLNFNEEMTEDRYEQVRVLRKQRIYTVSLMPLLIKAYTSIAKYVINYPQKEMKDYLKIILDNRCLDKKTGKQIWIWDKDGYNLMVNLYYILDLSDFYTYYETYEFPYTGDEDSYNQRIEKINQSHKQILDSTSLEYEEKIKKLENEIKSLSKNQNALKPIENEVINVVDKYLANNLSMIFTKMLNEASDKNLEDSSCNVATAFKRLFMSYFSTEIKSKIDVGNITDGRIEDSPKYKDYENIMFKRFAMWMDSNLSKELGL